VRSLVEQRWKYVVLPVQAEFRVIFQKSVASCDRRLRVTHPTSGRQFLVVCEAARYNAARFSVSEMVR